MNFVEYYALALPPCLQPKNPDREIDTSTMLLNVGEGYNILRLLLGAPVI